MKNLAILRSWFLYIDKRNSIKSIYHILHFVVYSGACEIHMQKNWNLKAQKGRQNFILKVSFLPPSIFNINFNHYLFCKKTNNEIQVKGKKMKWYPKCFNK
jgi:hypothetical protein